MPPPTDPAQVDHPELRGLGLQAAWVAKLEEATEALENLVVDLIEGDEAEPPDEDPLAVALSVVQAAYEDADRELEERAIAWLAADPEHWPIFRLVLLDPWQEEPGRWREGVPHWVRVLAADTVLAHFQQDAYGRGRELDL
ncbi:MAG: hypothetical protein M3Q10_18220 [Chloroflexota bacterium]|nr:hypothetical protein [Chloroflexota bacterium]